VTNTKKTHQLLLHHLSSNNMPAVGKELKVF